MRPPPAAKTAQPAVSAKKATSPVQPPPAANTTQPAVSASKAASSVQSPPPAKTTQPAAASTSPVLAKTASKSRPRSPSPTNSSKKQRTEKVAEESDEVKQLKYRLGL